MPGLGGYEKKETTLLAGESVLFRTDLAQGEFAKGNPEPCKGYFSPQEDVTLNNPLLPSRAWVGAAR
jgi:hypothetical protein